ncbi:30S ribosomal protein S9 [Elusimicrobiota bacterium]
MNEIHATGKRKTSVARVHMFSGKEKDFLVNKKSVGEYFDNRADLLEEINYPFKVTGIENNYLIKIRVEGGGKSGQAGAIRLGISRALSQLDEETRKILRSKGFLTRDARIVERKKPGRHKARKSEQYSKR